MRGARRIDAAVAGTKALAVPVHTAAMLALTLGVFAAACGSPAAAPTAPTSSPIYDLLSVSVNPSLLSPGDTAHASVVGWTRQDGARIYGPIPVTGWTSSHPSVATVNGSGLVTAVGTGTAVLTATFTGGSHAGAVSVFGARDIEGLEVSCISPVTVNQATSCDVLVRTRIGRGPVNATWMSSRPEVASLVGAPSFAWSTRTIMAHAPGQTVVTATYGDFQGTATIDVRD